MCGGDEIRSQFGNDANLEINVFPYNFSFKLCICQDPIIARAYTAQNTITCALLACLAFTSRCPTDKEGRGALEPPPEDFYVFRSLKPCRRQAKQTNAQALQTSSKTNAREYATAKFKTLATTVWKWCQFCKSSRRCRRQDTTKISIIPPRHAIFLQFLARLARHPSAFTSRCGTDTEGRGAFEPPPEDGA